MSTFQSYYLFAYGTLRSSINAPVMRQVAQKLEFVGEAEIKGKLYDMGDYPAARPAGENENSVIHGEVFKVTDPEEVFKALDAYEGSAYSRQEQDVTLPDGTQVKAFVYWYTFPVDDKQRIKQKDYLEYLKGKRNIY
jgi:gamma-glutamylcyclotransferase (GGCT)/AIG2-like uncharacterized protein YtfP